MGGAGSNHNEEPSQHYLVAEKDVGGRAHYAASFTYEDATK